MFLWRGHSVNRQLSLNLGLSCFKDLENNDLCCECSWHHRTNEITGSTKKTEKDSVVKELILEVEGDRR